MKHAVTVGPRHIEVRDVPEPEPGPGEALVQVEAVGICGSDLSFYTGSHPYARYPQTQGHEFSGRVVGFGDDGYEGPVRVGDRVAVEPLVSCGECYPCRRGRYNCCTRLAVLGAHVPGALAELIPVRVGALYGAGGLDPELAALAEPISIGLQGVVRAGVEDRERAVVFGAGPIGQAVLLAAVDRGARVLVVDKLASRLELAEKLGAEEVVEAGEGAEGTISDWTDGDGPAVVFEATGVPVVIRTAVEVVASSGRVVILGLSNKEVSLPVLEFTRKELTVLGSRNNSGLFGEAVALVGRNGERVRSLITHRFSLAETDRAIRFAMEHPAEAEKVMINVAGGKS